MSDRCYRLCFGSTARARSEAEVQRGERRGLLKAGESTLCRSSEAQNGRGRKSENRQNTTCQDASKNPGVEVLVVVRVLVANSCRRCAKGRRCDPRARYNASKE